MASAVVSAVVASANILAIASREGEAGFLQSLFLCYACIYSVARIHDLFSFETFSSVLPIECLAFY